MDWGFVIQLIVFVLVVVGGIISGIRTTRRLDRRTEDLRRYWAAFEKSLGIDGEDTTDVEAEEPAPDQAHPEEEDNEDEDKNRFDLIDI